MLSNEMLDRRTYNICIKKEFASKEQLERALREQQEIFQQTNSHMGIAEILVTLEIITEAQKESILFKKKEQKPERESIPPQEPLEPEEPLEPAAVEETKIEPISPPAFHLKVTWDRMEAHLHPNELNIDTAAPDLTELKSAMEAQGIRYGLLSDDEILEHFSSGWPPEKPLKIAEGKPPQPGINARVEVYFDNEPLKAGAIDESNKIDFKDRGEIPQVKEGDLMAVKIPAEKGLPGRDVCDGTVQPPESQDVALQCGEGTELSEDGLKILARQAGRPVVNRETVFSVIPDLKIYGDVGLETGHIAFDGNIDIEGSIHDGFRVLGKDLSVGEIGKAKVKMTGNIEARGGIIGAEIQAEGMVTSTHIHNATLDVSGDVVVQREIYDSTILTSGACIIERGKIINSLIIAKKGVDVLHLGSTGSRPCRLTVGVAYRLQKEIDGINHQISELKEELKPFRECEKQLQEKVKALDKEIEDLADKEAPCMAQQIALRKNLDGARERLTAEQIAKAEMALEQLDARLGQIQEAVEEKFSEQERTAEAVESNREGLGSREKEIERLEQVIIRLVAESEKDPGIPLVKVYGTLASQTAISGPLTSITVEEDYQRVRIQETEAKGPHAKDRWQMSISRL
ncbi:MAG: DUF342 domain-containing protein [Deltaproteobacteria bacterium]|nr:DUF342 domain-containing protein [Deltaproteobacteria bacterium]